MEIDRILNHTLPENEMNEKLKGLYNEFFPRYIKAAKRYYSGSQEPRILSLPYLLSASDNYCHAPKKVLYVGQETLGWGQELDMINPMSKNKTKVEQLMRIYDLFVNEDGGYSSPFWNYYESYHDILKADTAIMANNIAKIGFNDGGTGYNNQIAESLFDVFKTELSILNPDLILFMTSHRYDNLIKSILGDFDLFPCTKQVPTKELAKFNFYDEDLSNVTVIRTYHPKYLNMNQYNTPIIKEWIIQFLKDNF